MANVVEDLQRGTAAINDIETALKAKGVIGESEVVPVEDFDDRIEEIGGSITIDANGNNDGRIDHIEGADTIDYKPYLGWRDYYTEENAKDMSISLPVQLPKTLNINMKASNDEVQVFKRLLYQARAFHDPEIETESDPVSNVTFVNNYIIEGNDTSSPADLTETFISLNSSIVLAITHLNCAILKETFENIPTENLCNSVFAVNVGTNEYDVDLSSLIKMIPSTSDNSIEYGGLVAIIDNPFDGCSFKQIAGDNQITRIVMPDMLEDPGNKKYYLIRNLAKTFLSMPSEIYISNLDFSYVIPKANDKILNQNTETDRFGAYEIELMFKDNPTYTSGFGNKGYAATITGDITYDFTSPDGKSNLVDSFISFAPSPFTPSGSEKRIIILGYNEDSDKIQELTSAYASYGYTIQQTEAPQ